MSAAPVCASVCRSSLCTPEVRTGRNFHFKSSWISPRLKPLPPSNQMGPWGDWRVKGMWRSPLCKRLYFDSSGEEIALNILVNVNAYKLEKQIVAIRTQQRAEEWVNNTIKERSIHLLCLTIMKHSRSTLDHPFIWSNIWYIQVLFRGEGINGTQFIRPVFSGYLKYLLNVHYTLILI